MDELKPTGQTNEVITDIEEKAERKEREAKEGAAS